MMNRFPVENERPSGKLGYFFLVMPDIFIWNPSPLRHARHFLSGTYPPSAPPDMCNRTSIFASSFRMDPRHQPAGITESIGHARRWSSGIYVSFVWMDPPDDRHAFRSAHMINVI